MEIGLFQLENLILTRSQFVFFDLRSNPGDPHAQLTTVYKSAERLKPEAVDDSLRSKNVPTSAPVVLLCENGKASREVADRLEKAGYQNVYVVKRGEEGLLSEL